MCSGRCKGRAGCGGEAKAEEVESHSLGKNWLLHTSGEGC